MALGHPTQNVLSEPFGRITVTTESLVFEGGGVEVPVDVGVRLLVEVAVEVFDGVGFGLFATVVVGEMATGGGGSTYAISTSPNQ